MPVLTDSDILNILAAVGIVIAILVVIYIDREG